MQTIQQTTPTTKEIYQNPPCAAWRCKSTASASHVVAPSGPQERLCAHHWREAREVERIERAQRQLAELFGDSYPGSTLTGGARHLVPILPPPIAATPARTFANFAEVERRPA
jgi:hypothetical protein